MFERKPKESAVIPETKEVIETLTSYHMKLDHALVTGSEWVETSREIIDYFNRTHPVPKDWFFVHKGINVCETGMKDTVIAKMSGQVDQNLHGTDAPAKVENKESPKDTKRGSTEVFL